VPNIATAFREEIQRISRKEIRTQTESHKKAIAQYRRDIAALKRQVSMLERQLKVVSRRAPSLASVSPATGAKLRFVAKGLKSHRVRLGLSAADFGKLVGVSGKSVYGWESGSSIPRREQLAKIAAARMLGKREAARRLQIGKPSRKR
jgi:DNA-binding XRE family transcriptional regulator